MILFRLARLLLHLAAGLLTCALVFPRANPAERNAHIHRWSLKLLALCRVRLEVVGEVPRASHALVVANHISWLDIFVINAVQPHRFVAKSDIRDWPVIGWLCDKAGTIFIARGRVRDVRRIYEGLVEKLQAGEHVAFFPEGTTAKQGAVLPFHANLFEAAIEAKLPVQPFALRYVDGEGRLHPAADFAGETTLVQSVWYILGARDMRVQLIPLPLLDTAHEPHRRELAAAARASIVAALGEALDEDAAAGTPVMRESGT